jgi:hypothetical protein
VAIQVAPALTDDELRLLEDARWNLALRVAASPHFAKATQPREILLYVTKQSIVRGNQSISELEIAQTVLNRRANFDPNEDSIVRVQMSHIRKKLDLYFLGEGRAEPIWITIPKGSYVPHFELRRIDEVEPRKAPLDTNRVDALHSPGHADVNNQNLHAKPTRHTHFLVAGFAVMLLLLAILLFNVHRQAQGRTTQSPMNQYAQNPLISRIFGSSRPVSIVIADANFSMLEDTLKMDIPVHDYMDKTYLPALIAKVADPDRRQLLQSIYDRRDTSLGEADVAFKWGKVSSQFGNDASIRFARYLNVRDFESGNFVLIGSRRGMPWAELFESQLNFSYVKDPNSDSPYFLNRHPAPGEKAIYPAIAGKESYDDIALVPNLGHSGYVLLLRGLSMESNEGAADFLTSQDSAKALPSFDNSKQSIEILLRNHIAEGASSGFEVVAIRKF